jgi:hypothetical protein
MGLHQHGDDLPERHLAPAARSGPRTTRSRSWPVFAATASSEILGAIPFGAERARALSLDVVAMTIP